MKSSNRKFLVAAFSSICGHSMIAVNPYVVFEEGAGGGF
jgi:uncharacterized membrane protein YadS